MKDFVFYNPVKLYFGKKSMSVLGENVAKHGHKVMLVYGQGSIKKNGVYKKVKQELKDFQVEEFAGIEPNPKVESIRKAVTKARKFHPELILAVGGGSVIDAAKLIAAAVYYHGDAWDFFTEEGTEPDRYIPLGVVATMPASGSQMNEYSVISNEATNEKLVFFRKEVYPKFAILDPRHTYSLSKEQTAYAVIDPFSHVLEQYINTTYDAPLQDSWAESILRTLIAGATEVFAKPEDYDIRADLMLAATMALNGLIEMGVNQDWATHMIEHEISAFYDIPHAAGLAILTPHWMETVKEQKMKKLAQYGRNVWGLTGEDKKVATAAVSKTTDFFKSLDVPMRLSEWDVDSAKFTVITERLVAKKIGETPLNASQIRQILNGSL